MDRLLKLLREDARLSAEQLAAALDTSPEAVAEQIDRYISDKVIRGFQAVIDYDKADKEYVTSLIEIKVSPKRDFGFDEIASTIARFSEVEDLYLMSGGFDLCITVTGHSFKDIAMFVAKRLSPLDSVLSTSTHFVLKKYKDRGIIFSEEPADERVGG